MKKESSVVFFLNTKVDNINSLKFIIDAPYEDYLDETGETVFFDLKISLSKKNS